jgi:hypothetical protein
MELVSLLAAATADEADPGCCKAYLRRCLSETTAYLERTLGIVLPPAPATVCRDVERHPHGCRGSACAYHPDRARMEAATAYDTRGPVTPAVLATKEETLSTAPAAQAQYEEFFQLAYAPGALDARTKILVSLGASLAAGCAP